MHVFPFIKIKYLPNLPPASLQQFLRAISQAAVLILPQIKNFNLQLSRCALFQLIGQGAGFPGGTSGKEPVCQCSRHERLSSIPGSGRSPGGGHGNPLQYSCLENPMDRGAWQATVHGVTQSQTRLKHHRCSMNAWVVY